MKEVCIPVFLAILTSWMTSYLTAKYLKVNDNKNRMTAISNSRRALAKALFSELQALLEMYGGKDEKNNEENMKVPSEPPEQGKDLKIAYISQSYISVYESQLGQIGLLNEDDIPYIIEIYTYIKGLIDSHIYLAKRWEKYAQYTRDPDCNLREVQMKYEDVKSAHKAVYRCQEKIYNLYPNVFERLAKYDESKED